MDTCRACLKQQKHLRSINSQCIDELSYADIISKITTVKVAHNDGQTDKICLFCCRRTQDAFEFKKLVEKSQLKLMYTKLNVKNNAKKINFDSIDDIIKSIAVVMPTKSEKISPGSIVEVKNDIQEYHNTTIIKCKGTKEENYTYGHQLSVEEFLSSLKEENCEEVFDRYESENNTDDDYIPPLSTMGLLKASRKSHDAYQDHNKTKKRKRQAKIHQTDTTRIVPIVLEDVRLARTESREFKPRRPRKKKVVEKQTICPYCAKICKSIKSHLRLHTSERKFKCDKCPKAFFTSKLLEYHQIKHSDIRSFKCDQCTAAFYEKGLLNRHLFCHTDIRQHVCDTCSKKFKSKKGLVRHILTHSSANKTVMCELCNMSFFDKYQLRHHMRIHTGERPFNCEICSQPYSYKHDFNRHCLKKHGVFLKRRSVYVMNPEVLQRERSLVKELVLRSRGALTDDKAANPFEGPQAAKAYQMLMQALRNKQIPIDF